MWAQALTCQLQVLRLLLLSSTFPHLTVTWTCILRANLTGPDAQEVMPFKSTTVVHTVWQSTFFCRH